jgi:transposase InsO family protein
MSDELRRWNQRAYSRAELASVVAYLRTGALPQALQAATDDEQSRFRLRWSHVRADGSGRIHMGTRILVAAEDIDETLDVLYNDPARTGNRDVLYARVSAAFLGISRRRVWRYLQGQQTHQVLRARRVHPRVVQPLLSLKPFRVWAMDLINMLAYKDENDGFGYILVVIDVMTKHIHLRPIPRKFARETVRALASIFQRSPTPVVMISDNGTEFRAQLVTAFLRQHNVRQVFIPSYRPTSNSVAERSVRTVKTRLFAVLTQKRSRRWLGMLPAIQTNLNTSRHSSTGFTPLDLQSAAERRLRGRRRRVLTPQDEQDYAMLQRAAARLRSLAERRLRSARERASPLPELYVGDVVRVSYDSIKDQRKMTARKSYLGEWSESLFAVTHVSAGTSVSQPQYRLRWHPDGEPVHQRYYRRDLQRVALATLRTPPVVARPYIPPPSLLTERRTQPKARKIRRPQRFRGGAV